MRGWVCGDRRSVHRDGLGDWLRRWLGLGLWGWVCGNRGVPGDLWGGIPGDRRRSRLREGWVCLSLGKHGACPSIGKHINDDLGDPTLAAEGKGSQAVVAGQGGSHAAAVRTEVHIGDIRAEMALHLPECGFQWMVEHDCQGSLFYPGLVPDGSWPIEHDASKLLMRPGSRHHRFCRRGAGDTGRFCLLGGSSTICLLAVAWAAAGSEYDGNERPKNAPELCLSGIQNI